MKEPKLKDLTYNKEGTEEIRRMAREAKKTKITINFDSDVLNAAKDLAEETGVPYQTLLNRLLREVVLNKKSEESRLDKLEKEVKRLKKKVG